ncbi:glycosyltransferase family 4 protein [Aeromicrobium fastidiosum]|uniref:Glycosyltransferase family 4 protein n=1 Tax=Aeromicrobium fastidiosum TaxID=52699 RepID=A0A641AIK1_9ACTN|nr:glycosyltransferase family 4 protein [Aeromicrobium fastidiosum]KAA1373781.1 glycosyltransferase family 4 protein [Aeromicrobium fastidiosum]MBP2391355.1 glycosyltransferase involved in cell wall biosynthesis [Aeromicrobium fastidiosum]
MRIALLSYRTKEHCGGQGVYVRHLSRGLAQLGHEVEVFSGQPYPDDLDPRVRLTKVPSMDFFREPDPFRTPRLREFGSATDVLEYALTLTGCFAEPLTFSLRASAILKDRAADFDVVHDNQSLGYGLLAIMRRGTPLAATVHHPISRDRRVELTAATSWRRKLSVSRWYGFVPMQARVARRIPIVLAVAGASAADSVADFDLDPDQMRVVPLGVDTELFAPAGDRVPGRIVAIASADKPLKGVVHLLEALAKVRTEHDVHLELVSSLEPGGATERRIAELGIADAVHVVTGISDEALATLLASAEIMCVPSLYEGFSLPTVEAMSCGTPVVATHAGALPEVVGTDDAGISECAVLVEPGDAEALASAIRGLVESPTDRARLGAAGRRRALERYSWTAVAEATVAAYSEAVDAARRRTRRP